MAKTNEEVEKYDTDLTQQGVENLEAGLDALEAADEVNAASREALAAGAVIVRRRLIQRRIASPSSRDASILCGQ